MSAGATPILIDNYRHAARSIARSLGCPVFKSDEITENYKKTDIYSDGVHFNKYGYEILGNSVAWFIASRCEEFYNTSTNYTILPTEKNSITNGSRLSLPASTNINTIRVRLRPKEKNLITFTFYSGADVCELFLRGDIAKNTEVIIDSSNLRASSVTDELVKTTANYAFKGSISTSVNKKGVFIGRVMGKGWHSISISSNEYVDESSYVDAILIAETEEIESFNEAYDAYRVERRAAVIFDPAPSDGSNVPIASQKDTFRVHVNSIFMRHQDYGRWASMTPATIKIFTGIGYSENIIQPHGAIYNVITTQRVGENTPVVSRVKYITGGEIEISLERPKAGWIKIIIESYTSSIENSPLAM